MEQWRGRDAFAKGQLFYERRSADHLICRISLRDCRIRARQCRRSSMASRVYKPCFSAFLFPGGAPDPGAPPCMRHRFFQPTAGDRQGLPERVVAPQPGSTASARYYVDDRSSFFRPRRGRSFSTIALDHHGQVRAMTTTKTLIWAQATPAGISCF